jgi:hypothetical protein
MKKAIRKVKARWWIVVAVLFTALEIALPFFTDMMPRTLFGVLAGLAGAGAFASRLIAQGEVHGD